MVGKPGTSIEGLGLAAARWGRCASGREVQLEHTESQGGS